VLRIIGLFRTGSILAIIDVDDFPVAAADSYLPTIKISSHGYSGQLKTNLPWEIHCHKLSESTSRPLLTPLEQVR
jgi:hypothetical protein